MREKWFFNCQCKRCSDPTEFNSHVSTLKCQNCATATSAQQNGCENGTGNGGYIIPKSGDSEDHMCNKCGLVMTAKDIDKVENQ